MNHLFLPTTLPPALQNSTDNPGTLGNFLGVTQLSQSCPVPWFASASVTDPYSGLFATTPFSRDWAKGDLADWYLGKELQQEEKEPIIETSTHWWGELQL